MKRIIFSLLCCLVVGSATVAQTSVTVLSPHMINPAKKSLVREYQTAYPATVACYNSDSTVTFVYRDNNVQVREKTLEDYWVNDMVIVGEELYFCGRDINRKRGIIGGFNINAFFFGSGQVSILPDLYAGNDASKVLNLTRMAEFSWDLSNFRIACIGYCGEDNKTYPCLIDFNADFIAPAYTGGYVDDTKESFTDIKVVRGPYMQYYLVTAGFDFTYGRYINIRAYGPNSVFSPSGIQDMCHIYCIDTAEARPWLDDAVLLTRVADDRFVTVSYRYAPKVRDDIFYFVKANTNIHLGLFSLNDIFNNSTQALISNYEIPLGITIFRQMDEILYSIRKKRLVFLHTYSNESQRRSEFCDFDYNSLSASGTLPAFHDPDIFQQGLDLYNTMSNYILSGFNRLLPTTLKYEMETFGTYPQCVNGLEYNYERMPTIKSMNMERAFNTREFSDTPIHFQINKVDIGTFLDCER